MSATAVRTDFALPGLEETTIVPDEALSAFLAQERRHGGFCRVCSPCTLDGRPAFAVTIRYRVAGQ